MITDFKAVSLITASFYLMRVSSSLPRPERWGSPKLIENRRCVTGDEDRHHQVYTFPQTGNTPEISEETRARRWELIPRKAYVQGNLFFESRMHTGLCCLPNQDIDILSTLEPWVAKQVEVFWYRIRFLILSPPYEFLACRIPWVVNPLGKSPGYCRNPPLWY